MPCCSESFRSWWVTWSANRFEAERSCDFGRPPAQRQGHWLRQDPISEFSDIAVSFFMLVRPAPSDSDRVVMNESNRWKPFFVDTPLALVPLVCAATSISSLLLYMAGVMPLRTAGLAVLLPGMLVLVAFWVLVAFSDRGDLHRRLLWGCWAGLLATFLYDLVRVPMVVAGVPVFKAISYFGTVFVGVPAPTVISEIVGWTYHLSNGVGFALMYLLWVRVPRWWTAVGWGLVLEGVMLLTPYAEVFGYKLSRQFLTITIGAHIVYGLGIWMGWTLLSAWDSNETRRKNWRSWIHACWIIFPLGLLGVAADFHRRHGPHIPESPPAYIGPHLFTTWNVLEPDRAACMWIWSRFVDRDARWHFQAPFSAITLGKPFDVPEATIRRIGTRSATEVLLLKHSLDTDPKLGLLGRATHLYEITPWLLGTDPTATLLGARVQEIERANPGRTALERSQLLFEWLDTWYAAPSTAPAKDFGEPK